MKILAISGSLRAASVNSALLRATARLATGEIEVLLYAGVGELPLFNPDLEACAPPAVGMLRNAVGAADALIIASPEYAHGVTSAIKNTLDWLVSFAPFGHKPVAVFNASARSGHADLALREILRTMSARIVDDACFTAQLVGAKLDEDGMLRSPEVSRAIQAALHALQALHAQTRLEPPGHPANAAFALG